MKRITDTIKEVQYRRLLKRSFEPRKEFLESTRAAFLAEVATRRVAPLAPQFAWRALGIRGLQYTAAFVAVALLGTSSLVAFADSQNVQATHPLYQLKRIGEHVRLSVTPEQNKHLLHEEFAQRRATEVLAMRQIANAETDGVRERHETEIRKIKKDFQKNIEALEDESAVVSVLSPANVRGLCATKEKIEQDGGFEYASNKMIDFDRTCDTLLHPEAMASATTTTAAIQSSPDITGSIGASQKSSQDNGREHKNRNSHRDKKSESE
jgi:hypothetical protein